MVEMDLSKRMNQRRGWSQSNNVKLLVIMHVLSVMRKMPARNMFVLSVRGALERQCQFYPKLINSEQVIQVVRCLHLPRHLPSGAKKYNFPQIPCATTTTRVPPLHHNQQHLDLSTRIEMHLPTLPTPKANPEECHHVN